MNQPVAQGSSSYGTMRFHRLKRLRRFRYIYIYIYNGWYDWWSNRLNIKRVNSLQNVRSGTSEDKPIQRAQGLTFKGKAAWPNPFNIDHNTKNPQAGLTGGQTD